MTPQASPNEEVQEILAGKGALSLAIPSKLPDRSNLERGRMLIKSLLRKRFRSLLGG